MTENLSINDRDSLQKEFYRDFDLDYWLYKIVLLKNTHDNFNLLSTSLEKQIDQFSSDDCKRMIRTEMHFLYFQMVESLFEIIFAVMEKDNRDLWITLSFSNWRSNYEKISNLTDSSELFIRNIRKVDENNELPLLQWIFYFIYKTRMTPDEQEINLQKIQSILLIFARDFSDREEYNAYKHSLRFYNKSFGLSIGLSGSKNVYSLGTSKDSITFLEKQKKDIGGTKKETGNIMRTTKPFDFDRDFRCCLIIDSMIKNIIETRKYSLLPELKDKEFSFSKYVDVNVADIAIPKGGVFKSSFTV
jgi:hypothetical protein